MPRHRLSKFALLQFAFIGVRTELGVGAGFLGDDEEEDLLRDMAEIERRIKLVLAAEARRTATKDPS